MLERFAKRIEEGLASLARRIDKSTRPHILANLAPALLLGKLLRPTPQLRARRADHVAASRVIEPGDVVRAHHAPVHHPHAVGFAKALLHSAHDLLHRGHIDPVASEDLISEWHAIAGDYQRNVHLHAVGAGIARGGTPGDR